MNSAISIIPDSYWKFHQRCGILSSDWTVSGIEANSPDAGAWSRPKPAIYQQKDTNKPAQKKIRNTDRWKD